MERLEEPATRDLIYPKLIKGSVHDEKICLGKVSILFAAALKSCPWKGSLHPRHMSQTLRHFRQQLQRRITTLSTHKPNSVALAHSSWFRLPNQGMESFEVLSRGSGFLIHGPTTGASIAIVSAHVAAPHRFPAYFPHEWLEHVRDGDCRSKLEARSTDKTTGSTNHSLGCGFRHSKLDVAAFLLDEKSRDGLPQTEVLTLGEEAKAGAEVFISGFRLVGEAGSGSEELVEMTMTGVVKDILGSRGFIDTGEVESEMGMCGGAVTQDGKCIGVLEGLVPRPKIGEDARELHNKVGGCSVFIGARELRMFIHDVETEHARSAKRGVR